MNRVEELKAKIEKARNELDKLIGRNELEAVYKQSLAVDALVEEYIELTD